MKIVNNIDPTVADRLVKAALLRGLRLAGEAILTDSNAMVPHEEGALMQTGSTSDNGQDRVAVSYRDADYAGQAADQHENMTYRHDPGRRAKFLETARNRNAANVARILAAEARKATS